MVKRWHWVAATVALCLMASCRSLFESYLPESLEYLESQTNLAAELGGGGVTSVKLGVLPRTNFNPQDQLVVVGYTADGGAQVLFLDPETLKVRHKVTDAELRATNSGQLPSLQLIVQDHAAFHTGWVKYDFFTYAPSYDLAINLNSSLGGQGLTMVRGGYDDTNVVVFAQFTGNLGFTTSFDFVNLVALTSQPLGASNNVFLLDFNVSGGFYYLLAYEDATVHLVKSSVAAGVGSITVGQVTDVQPATFDPGGGWVTAQAAIVQSRIDKAYLLQAYSWQGQDLGTVLVSNSGSQSLSIAFDPSGAAWYAFDQATGLLSRQKAWW